MNKNNLKENLTDLQYKVTQEQATEPAYNNEYWDNHEEGIYVDIIDGTPLFSSKDKFDSGCGWPGFVKPIDKELISENEDKSFNMNRVEIRSEKADSHLGHVFEGWPSEKGNTNYCVNSAALRFIPRDELEGSEYDSYKDMF